MSLQLNLPSPLEKLSILPKLDLWIKRDDLIHPQVGGNKWRKLAGFFTQLPERSTVVTFGGAHSNHLVAVAAGLSQLGHQGIFVIRGDELSPTSSSQLNYCHRLGMQLRFIDRATFRGLRECQWQVSDGTATEWGIPKSAHWLPEGGSGHHNDWGCKVLWQELTTRDAISQLWLAAGTAGTIQSLLRSMPEHCNTLIQVISAVRGNQKEANATQQLAAAKNIQLRWQDETIFGGFAKSNKQLEQAAGDFFQATGIELDPVYNAKVWWHLRNCEAHGKIVWLNTGGVTNSTHLQAN